MMKVLKRALIAVPLLVVGYLTVLGIIVAVAGAWLFHGFREDGTSRVESWFTYLADRFLVPVLDWTEK